MARYGAEQIYAFAREAGFSPDQAVTMTAIALAESGGNSNAHNPHGEDSRGLWQINVRAHGDMGNLYDPLTNARAAFEVSRDGGDISPWTVTHGGMGARYLRHRSEAEAAARAYGDGDAEGTWTGTAGYGDRVAAGEGGGGDRTPGDDGDANVVNTAAVEQTVAGAGPADVLELETPGDELGGVETVANTTSTAPDMPELKLETPGMPLEEAPAPEGPDTANAPGDGTLVQTFLNHALAQEGDQYVFGAEVVDLDNPNPSRFDCSELVEWAAHQTGIKIPDGAVFQYRHLQEAGTTMSVEQAIDTPGALLFSFSSDPLTGRPQAAHVAISLGNGKTIEAMGDAYGVTEGTASASRFAYAAYIPELGTGGTVPEPAAPQSANGDHFSDRVASDPAPMDNDERTVQASERLTDAPPREPDELDSTTRLEEEEPEDEQDEVDEEIEDVEVEVIDVALAEAQEQAEAIDPMDTVDPLGTFGPELGDDEVTGAT